MTWLNKFKIAILNSDLQTIESLISERPSKFTDINEVQEATILTQQAIKIFKESKNSLSLELKKLKNIRNYIS
ncbi:hypothetical protein KDD93_05835 [Campylobacter sp. faydin G-24]|uniref:Uncharacterized protein n=1 Tax=Campylobacter anatolicus TaxID=2829105 RepID=A0ABS5HKM6_9BACT|nr:hypothetical protein [Campylobacter anatolicus]MBR8464092.1 hypothetical protein [Campylobacter anatolicus]MBR8465997.1 hypothetical protein [Campylobacter anatolicus]